MDRPDLSRNTASAPALLATPFPSGGDILYAEPLSGEAKSDKRRQSVKRRKTLLALIDELGALKDDEEIGHDAAPANPDLPAPHVVHERIKNHPIFVDDRLQHEGAEMFHHFNKRIRQVDAELLSFGNAVRPLGSSVGLISSAWYLRVRLQQILHLFRENASEIFPDKVKKEQAEAPLPLSSRKKSKGRAARRTQDPRPTRTIRPGSSNLTSDLEDFPEQFRLLAKDLVAFLHFLHDIPEFTDEELNASVLSFEADLKYWASCLTEFKNQFQLPSTKRYVNDLTREMDDHLESIRDALRIFVRDGVTTIRTAQNHTQNGLQNLSTVATFFSGVTASTLQFTVGTTPNGLGRVVNCLWISSLVFSIASAINSQLAYHWRAAMYRSPRSAVPWWVSIWLTRTPLIFLVTAVMAFSIGLVCFTHSSGQGTLVVISATIFTCVTSLALLAVALWFAFERWVFSKTKGSKWLWDIISETRSRILERTGLAWIGRKIKGYWGRFWKRFRRAKSKVADLSEKVFPNFSASVLQKSDSESDDSGDFEGDSIPETPLPTVNPSLSPGGHNHRRRPSGSSLISNGSRNPITVTPNTPTIFEGREIVASPIEKDSPIPILLTEGINAIDARVTLPESPTQIQVQSPARSKFQSMVRQVVRSRALIAKDPKVADSANSNTPPTGGGSAPPQQRKATVISITNSIVGSSKGRAYSSMSDALERIAMRPPRITFLIPALRQLRTSQYIDAHHGLVRHLQFSPDGKWLATCSWDRTAILWKVGDPCSHHKTLAHGTMGFVGQVAWSPSGTHLLTKLLRSVKIWTAETGVCAGTVRRPHDVKAITWLPNGTAFACVEVDRVAIIDLKTQKQIKEHSFERMDIHDVAFTPDEKRMLLVATLELSQDGLKPSKSRAEKRIIAYDLTDDTIESQVPVLERVRDITMTGDGQYALVSYEDTSPPELWRIAMVRMQRDAEPEARLTLVHTYIPATTVHFAGPSYFGGAKDQLIICAGKKGDIHIWDRESGLLLHTLQAANLTPGTDGGDLTGVAWNHNSPGQYMFASAGHDGTVRIWTAPAVPETQPPSRADSPSPGHGSRGTRRETTMLFTSTP